MAQPRTPPVVEVEEAMISETLSRIALMTGVGFDLKDISSRLHIDTGLDLSPDLVLILQAELGMARGNPKLSLQARLIASWISQEEAARIAELVWNSPVDAGIELATRGLLGRGSKVLQGVPRSHASICKASAELWRIAQGRTRSANSRIRLLAQEVGIDVSDLPNRFPNGAQAFAGLDVRVSMPRGGRNPFRGTQTA